jgi:hypothetical protein
MNMSTRKYILAGGAAVLLSIGLPLARAQATAPACPGLPPGKHSLLERMTAQFGLTCEQELKIEPLLHDEESVTKPLLKFPSFSAEEQQAFMLKIKLAARRQIQPLLTPDQRKLMDQEMESVTKAGKKGGSKKGTAAAPAEAFDVEEALSKAILAYAAFTPEEKRTLALQVKRAARGDSKLQLTADQQKQLDAGIGELSRAGK